MVVRRRLGRRAYGSGGGWRSSWLADPARAHQGCTVRGGRGCVYIAGAYRTLLKLVVGAVWKRGGARDGCISIGSLNWTIIFASAALHLPAHFHWTAGRGRSYMRYLHVHLWVHFYWISIRSQSMHHIHLRLLVHSQRTFGLDWFVCTRCPCVCWRHSIVLLAWPEGAHNLPLRLLVLPYRIYGLDQIMCTVCICVAYASPLDFWNGPECMHHVQLRSLVHLHWISD